MKNTFKIIFFLFISVNSFSQKAKKNLYLFISEKPVLEILNDTLVFQRFQIDFEFKNNLSYTIFIDDKGNLMKKINLKGTSNKVVVLNYKNINSNNDPIIVKKKDVINYLTYNEIIFNCNFENFNITLEEFNVYLINSKENTDNYYIAKKVLPEKLSGL